MNPTTILERTLGGRGRHGVAGPHPADPWDARAAPAASPLPVNILTTAVIALPCLFLLSRCPIPTHPFRWRSIAPKPGPTDDA
jgi:hypothetical protein